MRVILTDNKKHISFKILVLMVSLFLFVLDIDDKNTDREVIQTFFTDKPVKIDGNLDDDV